MSFKVVGLTFTCKLSWKLHISNIAKSAASANRHLRRARHVVSSPTLATIYKSHVRSRMEYCSAIWLGAPATSLALLDNVQSKAAKFIGHAQAIELQSLAHHRGVAALCALHRILHKSAPEPLWSLCPPRAPPARANTRSHARFFVLPRLNATTPTYWIRSFIPLMTVQWNNLPFRASRSQPPGFQVHSEPEPRALFSLTILPSLTASFPCLHELLWLYICMLVSLAYMYISCSFQSPPSTQLNAGPERALGLLLLLCVCYLAARTS